MIKFPFSAPTVLKGRALISVSWGFLESHYLRAPRISGDGGSRSTVSSSTTVTPQRAPHPLPSSAMLFWLRSCSLTLCPIHATFRSTSPGCSSHITLGLKKLRGFVWGPSRSILCWALSWAQPSCPVPQFLKSTLGTIISPPDLGQGQAGHRNPSQRLISPHISLPHSDFYSERVFPCLPIFILFSFSLCILSALSSLMTHAFETPKLKLFLFFLNSKYHLLFLIFKSLFRFFTLSLHFHWVIHSPRD